MTGTAPSRLDVVMPVRNAAATVTESILSALASPCCHRVLVIDDASEDATAETVEALASQAGGRVVLTRLTENGGPGYARNIGIALSQTDLVAFLDADDVYESQALEVGVASLDTFKDFALVRLALKPVGLNPLIMNHPGFHDAWTRVTFTVPGNVVVRRSVLIDAGGFPEDELFRRHGGEDVALLRAIRRTCHIGTTFTEPGVRYRIRPDCAALRLVQSHLTGVRPPGVADDLPKAEAITRRIMQRLRLLNPLVCPNPTVVSVHANWAPVEPSPLAKREPTIEPAPIAQRSNRLTSRKRSTKSFAP